MPFRTPTLVAILCSAAMHAAELPLYFPGPEVPAVGAVTLGRAGSYPSRGPLGAGEARPEFRRTAAIGSTTHAVFVTPPFTVPAEPLRLNVDTLHGAAALQRGAYVYAELCDAQGRAVPGYESEKCLIADTNALDLRLVWRDPGTSVERDTRPLAGFVATLRVAMRDARVYALHTTPAPARGLAALVLTVPQPDLPAWGTATFSLRGETKEGDFVPLDRLPVTLDVSDPRTLTARLDKRDRHRGTLTVARDLASPAEITLRASLSHEGRRIESASVTIRTRPAPPAAGRGDFRLYFIEPADLQDVRGSVALAAETLAYYADTRGLPTTPRAMTIFNRRLGDRYHVWGSSRLDEEGQVFRAVTADGVVYTTTPVESTLRPDHLLDMAYDPVRARYVAVERAPSPPARWTAHTSGDGSTFTRLRELYHDFDGIELAWDSANSQFVAFQLSFQRLAEPRFFADNVTSALARIGNRGRRIFTRRTSPDLVAWTPGHNFLLRDPATWTAPEHHSLVPDAGDPPDLECYWLNIFPYGDRYVGLAMFYAPAPTSFLRAHPYDAPPSLHGPHAKTEWIVSHDLVTWQRPFRDFDAAGGMRTYFTHAPLELHGRLLFLAPNQNYNQPTPREALRTNPPNAGPIVGMGAAFGQNIELYSLPQDRIAGARIAGQGSFLTKPFVCPAASLHLNARGTVAVALTDEAGADLPGFAATGCRLTGVDALHAELRWDGKTSSTLAGRTVRLRFEAGDATVYSVLTLAQ